GSDGLDKELNEPARKAGAEKDRGVEPRAEILDRRAQRRDEKMVFVAETILDLRDRRQDEAVEVRHDAARRGEEPARETFRSRLAGIFGLYSLPRARYAHLDALRRAGAAEKPLVQKRRVRHVERVLERRVERALDLDGAADLGVALRRRRQASRNGIGLDVRFGIHPDITVLLAHREARHGARR